jgi:hypothetical protein
MLHQKTLGICRGFFNEKRNEMKKLYVFILTALGIILVSLYEWPDKGHFISIGSSHIYGGVVFKKQNGKVYLKGMDGNYWNAREKPHYIQEIYDSELNQFRVYKKVPYQREDSISRSASDMQSGQQKQEKYKFKILLNNGKYLILFPAEVTTCKIADNLCTSMPSHKPDLIKMRQTDEYKWF